MASMRKSRLDKAKLMSLASKNKEKQITKEDLILVGDELVSSTIEGFNEELSKSPVLMEIAKKNSSLIKEFFVGYKEGVDSAIKDYISESNKTLEKGIERIKDIEKPLPAQTNEPVVSPVDRVLQRDKLFVQPKQTIGTRASEFGLSVLGEMFGLDKLTQERIESQRRKRSFIETESKLRPGVSRKQLEKDYKVITKGEQELSALSEKSSILKGQGYDEKQIDKILDLTNKQNEIIARLAEADPSRMGRFSTSKGGAEEAQDEQRRTDEKNQQEQEQQTDLLEQIRDILKTGKTTPKESAPSGISLPSIPPIIVPPVGGTPPIDPTTSKDGSGKKPKPPKKGGFIKSIIRIGKGAMRFAPWIAAADAVQEGLSDLLSGKKVDTLGDVVPKGWGIINPFEWVMRASMYGGEKIINQGYSSLSKEMGGSGLLGVDIHEGVQGAKNLLGFGSPKIESGKGVFAKNLSDYSDKKTTQKQNIGNKSIPDRQQQLAKQLGINTPKIESNLEGGTITSINGQEVPTSMLTDYEIERANNARRQRALLEGISEDKIKLLKRPTGEVEPKINVAKGEVAPKINVAKMQTPTAIANPPNVPFDPVTVGGETGEYVVPEPAAPKVINAIPAKDLTDPEAAMFQGALESGRAKKDSVILGNGNQESQRLRFEVTARKMQNIEKTPSASPDQKNIIVQVPPPTVIQQPPQTQVVPQPFTNNVRQNDTSLQRYIMSY